MSASALARLGLAAPDHRITIVRSGIDRMTAAQLDALEASLRLKVTEYIPHQPTPRQTAFLLLPVREALYGGAAGGGKSDALLMGALQYVDVPGYSALLLRKTFSDLSLPGSLMDRADEWLGNTNARRRDGGQRWDFPCPGGGSSTIQFGYLDENTKTRYRGAEFQYIGFDELTQFYEMEYRYLFSRLRRKRGINVPLRVRSGSNPGDVGHDWVKQRFLVEGVSKGRVFVPAKLRDNPHLDAEEYVESLSELDKITLRQLLDGDWSARQGGSKFRREWFEIIDEAPSDVWYAVRRWDLASTEKRALQKGHDPDWTAGGLVCFKAGIWYVLDMQRTRSRPMDVKKLVKLTARLDGDHVPIRIEEEGGSSGKADMEDYAHNVLMGLNFEGVPSSGPKEVRANPVSAAAEAGNIKLVRGPWNGDFLDEFEAFPTGAHDDQVDTISGAFADIRKMIAKDDENDVPLIHGGASSGWYGARRR